MAKKKIEEIEVKFKKEQLLESKQFTDKVDVLNVILEDDQKYSLFEVNEMIKQFYER